MLKVKITNLEGQSNQREFPGPQVSVGRSLTSDLVLLSPNISQTHVRIVEEGTRLLAVDEGSTNGTYINGQRISEPFDLGENDRIFIGDFVLEVIPVDTTTTPPIRPQEFSPPQELATAIFEEEEGETLQEDAADKIRKAKALAGHVGPAVGQASAAAPTPALPPDTDYPRWDAPTPALGSSPPIPAQPPSGDANDLAEAMTLPPGALTPAALAPIMQPASSPQPAVPPPASDLPPLTKPRASGELPLPVAPPSVIISEELAFEDAPATAAGGSGLSPHPRRQPPAGEDVDWDEWEVLTSRPGITGFADQNVVAEVIAEESATTVGDPPDVTEQQALQEGLLDCLRHYVELDEAYRAEAHAGSCDCGTCLLCRAKQLLSA